MTMTENKVDPAQVLAGAMIDATTPHGVWSCGPRWGWNCPGLPGWARTSKPRWTPTPDRSRAHGAARQAGSHHCPRRTVRQHAQDLRGGARVDGHAGPHPCRSHVGGLTLRPERRTRLLDLAHTDRLASGQLSQP